MSKKLIAAMMMTIILLPLLPAILASPSELEIKTDSQYYAVGDKVTVSVNSTNKINLNVTIYRYGNDTGVYFNNSLGGVPEEFIAEWTIPVNTKAGKYKTVARQNNTSDSTEFVITKVKTEELALKMIEKAREANETAYDLIKDDDSLSPAVRNNYDKGNESLAKAEELYDEGRFTVAIQMAHNAIVHFGNTVKIYEHDKDDVEDDVDEAFGLIERLNKTLTRLNQTAEAMDDLSDVDLDSIRDLIDEANSSLFDAKELLLDGKMKDAQDKLKEVKELIKDINDILKDQAKNVKPKLMEKFTSQMGKQLERLGEKIAEFKEKEHGKWQGMNSQLNNMEKQLVKVRERISTEMESLFGELDELRAQIESFDD